MKSLYQVKSFDGELIKEFADIDQAMECIDSLPRDVMAYVEVINHE
jgi:hypothetical protein